MPAGAGSPPHPPHRERSSRTHPGSSRQCPGPAEEAAPSWRRPRGQVPRPCPAVITEGARRPGPRRPAGSSGRPNRGPGPRNHDPWRPRPPHEVAEAGMGGVSRPPQGLGPAPCLSPGPQLTRQPEAGGPGGPRGEGRHHLLPHSLPRRPRPLTDPEGGARPLTPVLTVSR